MAASASGPDTRVGRAAAVALLLLAAPGGVDPPALAAQTPDSASAGPTSRAAASGQEAGEPVSADSASRLRAAMERPPARPPTDVYDVLSFPLRVAMLPLAAVGKGIQGLVALSIRPGRPPNPILVAYRDLREWGLTPDLEVFGPRSGPGAEVRLDRFEPFFLESGISIRGSQRHVAGLRAGSTGSPHGTLAVAFRRYAEPHFWGIGPDTDAEAEADFRWDQVELAGAGAARTGSLAWRLELGFEANDVGRGSDDDEPDLQDVAPPDLFGLEEETRFARLGAGVALDRTRIHVLQPRGFRADLGGTLFLGTGDTDADFLRWNAELAGYLPLNERQQLALRGLLELNRPQGGRGVPFTHLAALGGSRVNRGLDTWRFRDLDMAALQSEWRYEIWRSIHDDLRQEGFVFLDAGGVAGRIHELEGSNIRTSWGFGMRTASRDGPIVLWYLAFGEETKFRVKFSWPF